MGSTPTYIEVSPSRLSVCTGTRRNRTITSQVISREDLNAWYEGQSDGIADRIGSMLADRKANGPATIFYQSPTLSCDLYSCPSTIKDAASAAHLALAERSSLDLELNPWCIQPWLIDRGGSPRRKHLLIAADSAQSVEQIRSLAPGSSTVNLVPLEAPMIASAVDTALAQSKSDRPIVVVHFGQSRSVIAAAYKRQLLLVRLVDAGTDRLIKALASASNLPQQEAIQLGEELLFTAGLPTHGQTVTVGNQEFTASDILPAIQPVLQRMLVEIRQSIRFGLSGLEFEPGILLQGSGASIHRLAEAFHRELELPCRADDSRSLTDCTDIAFAIEAMKSGLQLTLRPQDNSSRASLRSSRIALYSGAVAAAAIGAAYGSWIMDQTNAIEPQLTRLASAQSDPDANPKDTQSATSVAAVRQTIQSIDRFVGPETDVASAIREICLLTADEVILTDLDINGGHDNSTCHLRGYLRNPGPDAAGQIRDLVDRLRESPLVESVRLDGTELATLDEKPTQYLSASITLTSTPPRILLTPDMIASANPEVSP
ncbi:MAG: hypothetical protein ACIAQF_12750 [Phycisphaerales bacterium JB065]